MYSYLPYITVSFGVSINNSAANGAETLISLDPWAIASIQMDTVNGSSKSLSIRCLALYFNTFSFSASDNSKKL